MKRNGSSLASTLLLISICVGLAFTVIGLAFHHLNMGNRLGNSQSAKNLAESAISLTIEKILKADGDYPKPGKHTVVVHFPGPDADSFGVSSFNSTLAATYGLDESTNNLKKDVAVTNSHGRVVPKESVHIVGLGSCRGVEKRIEAILHIPIFQSAISAEAPLNCQGPMLVAAADSSADDSLLTNPENFLSKLMPAHVTTNGDGTLGQDVLITGFCQAAGSIDVGSGNATVKGGIRAHGGQSEVPHLDVNDFDPAKLGRTHALETPSLGVFRADGGLIRMTSDVIGDELILPDGVNKSGAIVFVDGNIRIKEIRGVGAVIATGNISVTNSTNLSSDGTLAMLAAGNLSIVGQKNDADAIVKGIAYAGKSLSVNNVTLVGTMVQAGSGAGDALTVEKANFIKTDDTVDFEFDMPFQTGDGAAGFDIKMRVPLTDFYDSATDSYAVDVDGDGKFTNPPDRPRQRVQPSDLQFVDFPGGTPRSLSYVANQWFTNLPGPPVDPSIGTWSDVSCSSPTDVENWIVNNKLSPLAQAKNKELVNIQAFYSKFGLQPNSKGKISFNPSRFLTLTQAVRLILWKDL